MKDRPQVQDFDWTLLAIVAAICTLGVMEIYSSTHASAMAGMHWKQLIWLGIGIAGMFLISGLITIRYWIRPPFYTWSASRDFWSC